MRIARGSEYVRGLTFEILTFEIYHKKRNSLFRWEERVGGRNNTGIFKSQKYIFQFLALGKDPYSFLRVKPRTFGYFRT